MLYYSTALLRSAAPVLTYASKEKLVTGSIVTVALKSTKKSAVIMAMVDKPDFDTTDIVEISDKIYHLWQMEIAKFISEYYFSSFSEAISLFLPYNKTMQVDVKFIAIKKPTLTNMQKDAYASIDKNKKSLLFGVTSSGKTEIFISLISDMMEAGKASIFLMPEISLTPQMEKRLKAYFGSSVAMWHSKLTKKKKESILEGIESGEIRIVAGARSALFVPLTNIGLIIVDEEHDDSYKAMTRPRYHARDVAVLMADKIGAKLLLASATPSISSYVKYHIVKLSKPYIETQKIYKFVSGSDMDSTLVSEIKKNYYNDEQSLVFVPTRGNFKYLYCESCGKTHLCPYCSVGMALHRYNHHMRCHYCGYTEAIADKCSSCGHHPLKSQRMGTVEAKEILEEQIDGITIELFDKDSISSPKKLKDALIRFESGKSRVLLGTQMLSKGHDYANITLSVITGLDYIFGLADYRARERAMSLLFQIAGRSGRAKSATVIVQTNNPDELTPYLGDYELFLKEEIEFRRDFYPPFVSLARILIAHKENIKAQNITEEVRKRLELFEEIEIIGSGQAPIERIANKYRYHILLRSKKRVPLLRALHSIDSREIEIDMDPVEFS